MSTRRKPFRLKSFRKKNRSEVVMLPWDGLIARIGERDSAQESEGLDRLHADTTALPPGFTGAT